MNITTGLTGPFPRSEALVAATRDLDRGRTTLEAVDALYTSTTEDVVKLEERLHLDPLTGGYLRWPDLFRPFAETWTGFTVGPVTRWFETNTFFRQPVLNAPPGRVPGALRTWFPPLPRDSSRRQWKAILPGPYTFARLLDNRSGETPEALTHRLGRLYAEEVRELRSAGYGTFQFQEPLLVVDPPEGAAAEAVVAAYDAIQPQLTGVRSAIWTYFGDAAPVGPLLARLPVGAIGIDLAETEPAQLATLGAHRALGLGCVDPRTTLVEDPADVAKVVREVVRRLSPSSIFLGPGGPLDLLPWEPATRKLHVLPAAHQLLSRGD
ncbi:MAG: hypothetical protein WCA77_00515 [Thermoplasmata archaeon]